MRNIDKWKPTVICKANGHYRVNKNYVGNRSHMVAQNAIGHYVELMQKHARGRLLDLGCATVPYYMVYKDFVEEIICIDWDNSLHQNIHLDHTTDLNINIPLMDGAVDTVILTDVLEHISEPYTLTSEISRVLSVNGKLILGVPFMYWLHEEPYDFHRYTKNQLKVFCDKNNLEILTLIESGGPLTVIFDIIIKNLPWGSMAHQFQRLAIWFTNTKLGKRIDNRNKSKFPSGYFLVAQKRSSFK